MRLIGTSYECVDRRKALGSLSGIVTLQSIPGGLEVHTYSGSGEQLMLEDGDLEDDDSHGLFTVHTGSGSVAFVELQLVDFERLGGPDMFETPKFKTSKELQEFFWNRIQANYF